MLHLVAIVKLKSFVFLNRYFAIIKSFKEIGITFRLLKFLPHWCCHVLAALFNTRVGSSLLQKIFPNILGSMKSHACILNELTDDKELKAVLANTFTEHSKSICNNLAISLGMGTMSKDLFI